MSEEATFYKAMLYSAKFDENTVTIKVEDDFWQKFQVRKGVVYMSVGGGIVRIEQVQKGD